MIDEPVRVAFHMDQDPRLVGVFCSAVEHQATHAGFEPEAGAQLAKAAGDICRETIAQLEGADTGIDVTLDTFRDRIEVAIHSRGQAQPTVGLESQSSGAGGLSRQELLSRVDRVLFTAEDGVARTTLVKFLPAQ